MPPFSRFVRPCRFRIARTGHPSVRLLLGVAIAAGLLNQSFAADHPPTDDADAFKRIDLYADRTAFQNTGDHSNITQYPALVNSDQLLAIRGPNDTVCVIRSAPYDGTAMSVTGSAPQSFCEYAVSPARYATSIAVILMNANTFNGTGAFNDFNKIVARVVVRYVDATTFIESVRTKNATASRRSGGVRALGGSTP